MRHVGLSILALALGLGCGQEGAGPAAISVSVYPENASLLADSYQNFIATVANDPVTQGVTWTMSGCTGDTASCGSLTDVTNSTATYAAPSPIPADAQLTITATSVADAGKSFTVTVAIKAIRVSVSPASTGVVVNGKRVLSATLENDPTDQGVRWSITGCAGGPAVCGSLSNVTSTMAIYHAPSAAPPGTLGVTATSVIDDSKSSVAAVEVFKLRPGGQILFSIPRAVIQLYSEVYVMNPDGSGRTNLTNDLFIDCCAFWLPDGKKIAFLGPPFFDLFVMNADGSGVTKITNKTTVFIREVGYHWSPDGSKISFTKETDGPVPGDLYLMNADGSDVRQLTYGMGATQTSWSPDGTKIIFLSGQQIYVINPDGSGLVKLTNDESLKISPSWSPNGTTIAFASEPIGGGNYEIYVMNIDGSGVTRLTNSSGDDYSTAPVWSPDGMKIAFTRTHGADDDIYVMNSDGSDVINLSNHVGWDYGQGWSPDGTQILFGSNRDGNHEVYVVNADGSGLKNITNDPSDDLLPVWRQR